MLHVPWHTLEDRAHTKSKKAPTLLPTFKNLSNNLETWTKILGRN